MAEVEGGRDGEVMVKGGMCEEGQWREGWERMDWWRG